MEDDKQLTSSLVHKVSVIPKFEEVVLRSAAATRQWIIVFCPLAWVWDFPPSACPS